MCPQCGSKAYVGLSVIECSNPRCVYYCSQLTFAIIETIPELQEFTDQPFYICDQYPHLRVWSYNLLAQQEGMTNWWYCAHIEEPLAILLK